MTDTQTQGQAGNSRKQAERKVEYGELVVLDELPGREQKQSPIKTILESLKADTAKHGKWVGIGRYENGSAATAAANVERQRRGQDGTISGWEFATRRVDSGEATILFAKYDPGQVEGNPNERHQRHQTWLAERKQKAEAKRAEREASGKVDGRSKDARSAREKDDKTSAAAQTKK